MFHDLDGVVETYVGYTGGDNPSPTYHTVCLGDGHTEAVRVEYDPERLSYQDLLDRYWEIWVGPGSKAQYKSAIWCDDLGDLKLARQSLKKQQASGEREEWAVRDKAITIEMSHAWHDAEEYHQHHLYGKP